METEKRWENRTNILNRAPFKAAFSMRLRNRDIFHGKRQNNVLLADVDLAVPVILQTVELCIIAQHMPIWMAIPP